MDEEEENPNSFPIGYVSSFLMPFIEACIRTDLEESEDEEYLRYQRPFNYYRTKNNDGA